MPDNNGIESPVISGEMPPAPVPHEEVLLTRNRDAEAAGDRLISKSRRDWHTYFMHIAREVATRGTCDRKQVGAIIVSEENILSTGYNGSIRGLDHCDDVGHDMSNGHCRRTIHAEANAIIQAARNGVKINGADIYTTASPCWECFKLIANVGIRRIFYAEFYREEKSFEVAAELGIELIRIRLDDEPGAESSSDVSSSLSPANPPVRS